MNQPSWLKDAVFYNIYPQSFYDSNADGIGDLPGITQKLPYLHEMGFNAIWLNPFYVSPFRDAGYDIADFYKVAPRYGTNDDFAALCRAAHEQGIRVVVDLVAGHTALECEWFQKSAQPEKNELSNRYIWTDDWQKDYHGMGVGGLASRNGMFLRNFFYCQPALNYGFKQIDDPAWQLPMDHPDCRATKQALLDIMEFWLALGADGFRVDMASSLIKNDPDGSGIRAFWQEIRRMFDEKHPDCVLISEWSYPERAIAAGFHIDFMIHFNLAGYTSLFRAENRPQECNCFPGSSFFQKDGNGCIENFLRDYQTQYAKTDGRGYISLPTGNHDMPRLAYHRTLPEIADCFVFLLTMPGVPFVYYGDEIGMPYIPELPSKEGGFSRTGARTPMQWTNGKNAGFSEADADALYLPVDEHGVSVQAQMAQDGSLLRTVQKLIALRKSSSALCADGRVEFLNRRHGGYPLVYRRYDEHEEYTVCINPLDEAREYALDGKWETALAHDAALENGTVQLQPFGYVILKKA